MTANCSTRKISGRFSMASEAALKLDLQRIANHLKLRNGRAGDFIMSKMVVLAIFLIPGLSAAQSSTPMPDGPGKAVIQRACAGCHSLKVVTSKRARHDEWAALVDQMVSKGAEVSDDDIEVVVQYLTAHYGPPKDQNTAPAPPDKPSISHASDTGAQRLQRLLAHSGRKLGAEGLATESVGSLPHAEPSAAPNW
jgi:cytochrome c5